MTVISRDINKAKNLLSEGKLVAIPTETVYGLAANAYNIDAIANLFSAKERPHFDPLIVHISTIPQGLGLIKNIPNNAIKLMEIFWPGPLTLVLEKKNIIPDLATSGLQTVGLRMPNHPLTLELLANIDFPLVAPSANPFGYISPTCAQHVFNQLKGKIDLILDGGESEIGIESTIIAFESNTPLIYRLGGITVEEIENVVGEVHMKIHDAVNDALAPGMLENHYAPSKKTILGNIEQLLSIHKDKKVGVLSFNKQYQKDYNKVLTKNNNLKEACKNLFSFLRWLDNQNIEIILAELVPNVGLGRAINDRLRKAAEKL